MQIFAYPLGESEPAPRPDDVTDIRFVRMASSPFGLYGVAIGHPGQRIGSPRRSDQSAELTLYQPDQNAVLGTLRLNNGPAYGSEIVDSVAQTWLIASALAVMIAGAVGWFISQQLSNPLLSLTRATERMANGDLSVRTALKRRDELGLLSSAFDEMAGQIENTVVALRRFVADAAHELHTPLTALRTNLELSIERADRQALDRALEQLKRLELLADDLLDLSRIESDPAHMPRQPLEITPLVQQISEVYASRAEQADLDYVLELPDKAPIIAGNPAQIQRLIANLLDNAIKFTPAGGQIAVKIHQKGEQVELTVEDSGIGIPQEDLPYLFERFRRGRNTAQYPGSGLGLAIVRAIVCAHHGTVHAHSQGCGTKISVLLPTISPKAA